MITTDTNKIQFTVTETSLIIMYGGYFDSYSDNFYFEIYLWDLTTINDVDITGNNSQKLTTLNNFENFCQIGKIRLQYNAMVKWLDQHL